MEKIDVSHIGKVPKKKTEAPHELADSVNLIKEAGLLTEEYGWGYWLTMVKRSKLTHFQMEKLMREEMPRVKKWLKQTTNQDMECGSWLTNKLAKKKNNMIK